MKLFPADSNVYLLQINSLKTTVAGVYILGNHCFFKFMVALLGKIAFFKNLSEKKGFYNRFFEEGQVFPRRANADSRKQQQWFHRM